MKTRPKGAGSIPLEREPADGVARLRLGSYEFKKKGVSRFDLRDPYHLAVALTWPQFLAALLALSVGECRLHHTLLASIRFGGERSAGQLLGRLLLQHRDAGYGR